jgi:hypothetical protein
LQSRSARLKSGSRHGVARSHRSWGCVVLQTGTVRGWPEARKQASFDTDVMDGGVLQTELVHRRDGGLDRFLMTYFKDSDYGHVFVN